MGGAAPPPRLSFAAALAELESAGRFGMKLGLERIQAILQGMGNPQAGLRGALVAGTNGKGSVCAFLAAILEAAGLRTGRLPSPHLAGYRERVLVGEEEISERDFVDALEAVRPALDRVAARLGSPTHFEMLVSLGLWHLRPRIDRLVCEVGMGGRLDVTNALDLGVAVVTNVSLDHTEHLGDSVAAIAAEKAAIIKPGNRVVTGCTGSALAVVEEASAAAGAQLWRLGHEVLHSSRSLGWAGSTLDVDGPGFAHRGLRLRLAGSFQVENAALAVAAAQAMGDATGGAVRSGVEAARWAGRLQRLEGRPPVILDGGHNPAGLRRVVEDLAGLLEGAPLAVVFGAMADKALEEMLSLLRQLRPVGMVFTRAAGAQERAAAPDRLAFLWGGRAEIAEPVAAALARARQLAGPDGAILVCGSLYVVGEVGGAAAAGGG